MSNRLYFKQIEIGPMQNYVYLIGSAETRKVAVVDAAWEIDTILKIAAQDGVEITHAFVTHTHPDHVGGRFANVEIPGVDELLSRCKAKVVVHKAEVEALKGLAASDVIKAESGDKIDVGGIEIQLLHTPGHTPGSQCFLVDGRIVSGDTLFTNACGRVNFPGGIFAPNYFAIFSLGANNLPALAQGINKISINSRCCAGTAFIIFRI